MLVASAATSPLVQHSNKTLNTKGRARFLLPNHRTMYVKKGTMAGSRCAAWNTW